MAAQLKSVYKFFSNVLTTPGKKLKKEEKYCCEDEVSFVYHKKLYRGTVKFIGVIYEALLSDTPSDDRTVWFGIESYTLIEGGLGTDGHLTAELSELSEDSPERRYFTSKPGCGVFVLRNAIVKKMKPKIGLSKTAPPGSSSSAASSIDSTDGYSAEEKLTDSEPVRKSASLKLFRSGGDESTGSLAIERISVNDIVHVPHFGYGMVRFVGKMMHNWGEIFVGVELLEPRDGAHSGTVERIQYFHARGERLGTHCLRRTLNLAISIDSRTEEALIKECPPLSFEAPITTAEVIGSSDEESELGDLVTPLGHTVQISLEREDGKIVEMDGKMAITDTSSKKLGAMKPPPARSAGAAGPGGGGGGPTAMGAIASRRRGSSKPRKWPLILRQSLTMDERAAAGYRSKSKDFSDFYEMDPLKDLISEGTYGEVFRCKHKTRKHRGRHRKFAVKRIDKRTLSAQAVSMIGEVLFSLRTEINCLKKMRAARKKQRIGFLNVMQFVEAFEDPNYLYIVTNYCNGGTLYDLINEQGKQATESVSACATPTGRSTKPRSATDADKFMDNPMSAFKRMTSLYTSSAGTTEIAKSAGGGGSSLSSSSSKLSETEIKKIMLDVLQGLHYLSSFDIAHLDLNPSNIMRVRHPTDKSRHIWMLIDFGMARVIPRCHISCGPTVGTVYFVAPEVINGRYHQLADMWSFGVILFFLIFGYPPFGLNPSMSDQEIMDEISQGFDYGRHREGKGPWIPVRYRAHYGCSDEVVQLIEHCLQIDLHSRITVEQALDHAWFKMGDDHRYLPLTVRRAFTTFTKQCDFRLLISKIFTADLTFEERKKVRDVFKTLDPDGRMRVDKKQFVNGMLKFENNDFTKKQLETMFDELDLDREGKLILSNLEAVVAYQKLVATDERLEKLFDEMKDENGFVTEEALEERLFGISKSTPDPMLDDRDIAAGGADSTGPGSSVGFYGTMSIPVFGPGPGTRSRADTGGSLYGGDMVGPSSSSGIGSGPGGIGPYSGSSLAPMSIGGGSRTLMMSGASSLGSTGMDSTAEEMALNSLMVAMSLSMSTIGEDDILHDQPLMKQLSTVPDKDLSPEQRLIIRALRSASANGDGKISREEFLGSMHPLLLSPRLHQLISQDTMAAKASKMMRVSHTDSETFTFFKQTTESWLQPDEELYDDDESFEDMVDDIFGSWSDEDDF